MGPGLQNLFLALEALVWSKHKEGEGGGGLGSSPGSATAVRSVD